METFKTIKCSQIITKNRIEKESDELDQYFETSRKRKFAEVENEFVACCRSIIICNDCRKHNIVNK